MANNFNLTLDTTAPGGVAVAVNGTDTYVTDDDVTVVPSTTDGDTTGYQVKIYGDVSDSFATSVYRADEADAPWVALSGSPFSVRLSAGDGSKTVRVKIRDDVWNASSEATDTVTLDTSLPVVTITSGPDATKVSKVSGKRTSNFAWQADVAFVEYKIKVVPASDSLHSAGTAIPETNSTNMDGTGTFPATTPISSAIDGRDLETASSGDGVKIVKVFVKEHAEGAWSV